MTQHFWCCGRGERERPEGLLDVSKHMSRDNICWDVIWPAMDFGSQVIAPWICKTHSVIIGKNILNVFSNKFQKLTLWIWNNNPQMFHKSCKAEFFSKNMSPFRLWPEQTRMDDRHFFIVLGYCPPMCCAQIADWFKIAASTGLFLTSPIPIIQEFPISPIVSVFLTRISQTNCCCSASCCVIMQPFPFCTIAIIAFNWHY